MADRYWVGGTETWDNTPGTKWAATSGGAGGESVPTIEDDVYFNDASSGTITLVSGTFDNAPKAKTLNFSGFPGTITGNAGTFLYLSGDLTLTTGMTWSYSQRIVFLGSGTLITAGNSFNVDTFASGSTASLTLGDAFTATGTSNLSGSVIVQDGGSFNTNNYSFNGGFISGVSGSASLGSSTITLARGSFTSIFVASGFNLDPGTSQINFTNSLPRITCSGTGNFNDLNILSTGLFRGLIEGSLNCNNFTVSGTAASGFAVIYLDNDITVSGTLTCSGESQAARVFLAAGGSNTTSTPDPGKAVVITASSLVAPNCDFRDITLAGNASGSSPSGAGDCGGNTGIVFPAPKTVYRVSSGMQWYMGSGWATTSSGAGDIVNFPLPQDTVIIDDGATVNILFVSTYNLPEINCSGRTNNISVYFNGNPSIFYGSLIGSSGVTFSGGPSTVATYVGRGIKKIATAGNSVGVSLGVSTPSGGLELEDALTLNSKNITTFNGTFDTSGYALTTSNLDTINMLTSRIPSAVPEIKLGASVVNCQGVCELRSDSTVVDAGTSSITFTSSAGRINAISGGPHTFNDVLFTTTSTGGSNSLRCLSGLTFNNLTKNIGPTAAGLSQINILGPVSVNNNFVFNSGSLTRRGFIVSETQLGQTGVVITASSASLDYCDFRGIALTGNAAGTAFSGAGDCGGNAGITFPAAKNVYRVGTNTTWTGSSSWALTSSGAGSDDNFPLAHDTAIIDDATALTGTLAFGSIFYNFPGINCSGRTSGITLNHNLSQIALNGSYVLGPGVTVTGSAGNRLAFTAFDRTHDIFTAGKALTFGILIASGTPIARLQDDLTITGSQIEQTGGTFNANNYNVNMTAYSSPNSTANAINEKRTLIMGSGLWTLTGQGTIWNIQSTSGFTLNKGTANILFSNTGIVVKTFTVNGTSGLAFNKLTIGSASGSGSTLSFGGSAMSGCSFTELDSTNTFAHSIAFNFANGPTINKWSVAGTSGNFVTLTGNPSGARRNFRLTQATSGIDYLIVRDIGELNDYRFAVGENSIDGGNNLNVYFTATPPPAPVVAAGGNMFLLFP